MKRSISILAAIFLINVHSSGQSCSAIPDQFFVNDTIIVCQGNTYQLDAPVVAGCTYTWSTSEAGSTVMIMFNGRYILQIANSTCIKADTVTVLFNSFLLSPLVEDLKLCKGTTTQRPQATGQNILWYTTPLGGTASTAAPIPSTADTSTTTHWVSQTIRGCESPRVPLVVKVIDKPKFELGDAFIIPCDASGIVLQVIPDEESNYAWSNGSNDASIMAPTRGRYWLYAENMCGNHSDSVVAVECKDKCVQLPTAFTPNNDGKNDEYKAASFCPVPKYLLMIYNRNGEIVFQTKDPSAGWNGYFRGQPQPVGVYIFNVSFFDFVLKREFTEKGTIVLMR
ncbi:MAG: gliding motility-associated C-terminal domain-containing protein [Chitinophagaceae bacterium]|nr:gliding motility-associated C-terminal domain-containing protein [Chitinophagaceae bacterium]